MNILCIHQNFPGQFKHLAPALARLGHKVVALHINPCQPVPGVEWVQYSLTSGNTQGVHRWLADLATKTLRAEAAWQAGIRLRDQGFTPDVIVAHPGWGESLFIQQVWPLARMGIYCEFFYHPQGADVGFDPEFGPPESDSACRLQMKNANYELHFARAHAGIAPTHWQASLFPPPFASRITVMHDGIRTDQIRPDPTARIRVQTPQGVVSLGHDDEVSYGAAPAPGPDGQARTWRQVFLDEVKDGIDLSRVHFVGKVPYADFLRVLQVSTVHVYLTYPFVLSWSLLEAMSAGCAIVASDTAPVREAIRHGETGLLLDFFDPSALAQQVAQLCQDPATRVRLGAQTRAFAVHHCDLETKCLPGQMAWVEQLARL